MKHLNIWSNGLLLLVVVFLASCSQVHYSHLNKIPRGSHAPEAQATPDQNKKQPKPDEIILTTPQETIVQAQAETESTPVSTIAKAAETNKESKVVTSKTKKTNKLSLKEALALQAIKKMSKKLNNSFAEHKNIARDTHSERSGSSLLYIIIVILIIIFLLGAIGGKLGGLIGTVLWLVLVIALVLFLLRILGLA